MRDYTNIRALARGEVIDLDGIRLKMSAGPIRKDDLYVAEHNTGPKLLTARKVVMAECGCCVDMIVPTTNDYPYDGHECVKVEEA